MQCSMAWALHRTEKEKPAAGKTDYWRDFWRSGWDSNPRNLAVQLISSQSRYDHFDTAPFLSQHQHLGKRGELMGRTSKNIKLRIPEKPHKIKGFRSGSYRVATTISSQGRYNHFDTTPYKQISDTPENCLSIIAVSGRKIKCGFCKLRKTGERTSDSGGPGGKSPPGLLHFQSEGGAASGSLYSRFR